MLRKTEKAEPTATKSASELNYLERLLTPREAADYLRVSDSWLAKARMRGDGPPFLKVGRSIRYSRGALVDWMNSQLRSSTSQRDWFVPAVLNRWAAFPNGI